MIGWMHDAAALLPAWKFRLAIGFGLFAILGVVVAPFSDELGLQGAVTYLGLLLAPVLYLAGVKRKAEGKPVFNSERPTWIMAGIAVAVSLIIGPGIYLAATTKSESAPAATTTAASADRVVTSAGPDLYDCAAPTVEVLTFDWRRPQGLYALGVVRARITNNSKHKISTSGAKFNLAWRGKDGALYDEVSLINGNGSTGGWIEVPWHSVTYAPADTVRGHDSIEYRHAYSEISYSTDGSEPWVHQSQIFWRFDNPDLEQACQQQRDALGEPQPPR